MSQQPSSQTELVRSLMGQDKTPERESSEESSGNLLTPPTTDPGEEIHTSRSGISPLPLNPPSYFDRGQPGFREPLPRGRTPLSRAPGFGPRPRPRVQRPSSTPLRNPSRTSVDRPPRGRVQRVSSHQALQLGNDIDRSDVEELGPGLLTGNGGTQPNNTRGRTPALPADRLSLSFGPPITSQQSVESSGPVRTASGLAASPFRGHTRATRTTSSWTPESVPRRAPHSSPYNQHEPDEPVTQYGHHGAAVATSAATYLARREAELWDTKRTDVYRGAHKCQMDRTVPATNGASRRRTDPHVMQGDRPSNDRGQYERPVDIPQPRSDVSSTLLDVQSASKRPRSGNSSPTDQPATQRPRTSITESSCDNQLHPRGVGGSTLPQPRTSVAPSASFSIATISRRTIVAASSTPDPTTCTSPPRMVDVNSPRPSNITPPNPRRSTSTPRAIASDSGYRRSSLATPPRSILSRSTSPINGRETDIRQTRTSTPPVPRSSSIASASPASRNTTSGRNGTSPNRLSSPPDSRANASNDRRSSTPASSESQPSATSKAHATTTPPVWDEGFDYWSLTPHQRTTYRHGHSQALIAALRSGPPGIPNADPSRFYRENNPEDPRIERIMDGLHVTRDEAIGMILGHEEVRKQSEQKNSAAQTPTTVTPDAPTPPQKRPRTEERFRREMARLHPPRDGHRRVTSQPPAASDATQRHRPRSLGPNHRAVDGEPPAHSQREERHYRCHLPPDPITPFQHPLAFLTKPSKPLLDDTSPPSHKSLHPRKDLTPGFRTVAHYDALCRTLHRDCKRAWSSIPHLPSGPAYLNPGLPFSAGYCLSTPPLTKRKHILSLSLSLLLFPLLVCGSAGVVAAGLVVALLILWVLLL